MFDFECTQNIKAHPTQMKFKHNVNFIAATVICTACLREGDWNKPLKEVCHICGEHRTFTWSIADFKETPVDKKFITKKPLVKFVRWLLYNFNIKSPGNKYENVIFSHNGYTLKKFFRSKFYLYRGRYDNVLIFGELFNIGGLQPEMLRQGNLN